MSVIERKINRQVVKPVLFYVVVRNMDKLKYYCHFADGEIEE